MPGAIIVGTNVLLTFFFGGGTCQEGATVRAGKCPTFAERLKT